MIHQQYRYFQILMIGVLLSLPYFATASEVGQRFPSERKTFVDSTTGYAVTAITTDPAADIKTYQTHPQWTPGASHIVFRSNRTGSNQYFAYEEATGELIQLTQTKVGTACLSRKSAQLYYFRMDGDTVSNLIELNSGSILKDSAKGKVHEYSSYERVVATFPPNSINAGGLSLDAEGDMAYYCIRHTDTSWTLNKINLATGKGSPIIELSRQLGHIQANPWKSGEILYCHETGGDAPQRMWMINADGTGNRPLYVEAPTEWVTHEVWVNKDTVFFNLGGGGGATDPRRRKPHGIASINVRTNEVNLYDQLPGSTYWHCAATQDKTIAIGDSHQGDIYLIDLINGSRTLLTAKHLPQGGPAHPHQNISPDGRRVLFGSAYFGNPDLMIMDLP